MDRKRCLNTVATSYRFSVLAGQEGYHFEDLLLRNVGWKGQVTRAEKTVGWNVMPSPSHMAVPICSGISLHVS